MLLKAFQFLTIVLSALSLTMESAHTLELPQKMHYGASMYSAVNSTLYRYFAIVGGSYQITAIVAAGVLAFLLRQRWPPFGWTLAGVRKARAGVRRVGSDHRAGERDRRANRRRSTGGSRGHVAPALRPLGVRPSGPGRRLLRG